MCVCYNGGTCVVINGTESCQCPSGKFFKTQKKYYFGSLIVQTKEQFEGLSFIKKIFLP